MLAMAFRIIPVSHYWSVLNPDWIAMVLIYWIMSHPDRVGVGSAWVTGLFADVLTGRLLGQHALAYSVIAYLTLRWHKRLRFYSLPQQCLWILILLLIGQLLVLWTQNSKGVESMQWSYWLPSLSGALIWPLLIVIAQAFRLFRANP